MDEKLAYNRDGIVFPIAVLTDSEVSRYRRACEQLESDLGGRPRTVEVRQMHLHFRWAYELATHRRVLATIEKLLGPDLLVWSTELFAKRPGDGISIGWHRDEDYTGFDPELSTTAWIALSRSTPANGCLQIVPGSHDTRLHLHVGACEANGAHVVGSPAGAVAVTLAAGEMSLHDGRLMHGSTLNASTETRIGFAIRYVVPAARPAHGRPVVLLAQGEDRHHHFQIVPPPSEADEHALEQMRMSASRHLDEVLENLRRRRSIV